MSNVVKTATSSTTCVCCGGGALATLTSRQRGGTAALCGISENAGYATTPPKKYRRKRTSGFMTTCNSASPCTTPSTSFQQRYTFNYNSGTDYNVNTCGITNFNSNFTDVCTSGPPPPPVTICPTTNCSQGPFQQPVDAWKGNNGGFGCFAFNVSLNTAVFGPPTSQNSAQTAVTRTAYCCSSSVPTIPGPFLTSGTIIETLTIEDTDTDAYNRAAPTFTWSAFSGGAISRVATQAPRTTGFSFTLVDVQFNVAATGYTPGSTHTVTVEVWRAITGTGVYSLFQTLSYSPTADGSGNISFNDSVPNASGFDSFVTNPRVF